MPRTGPKILVLDDSPTVRATVRYELEAAGMSVVETDNPIAVPYLVWKEQPDILLVDVMLPAMTGDEVVRLVGRETRRKIRVILYSSMEHGELIALARRCGADCGISKSDRAGALTDAVERCLSRARRAS